MKTSANPNVLAKTLAAALVLKFGRRLPVQRKCSRILLACVVVSVLAWLGPSANSQSRALTVDFRMHANFHSKFLKKDRSVIVWLPPGYHSETTKRYPVLYMHDGGVVFISWRIDEIAKPLITSRQVEPLIIVMVNHGGTEDDRFDEYTPTKPPNFPSGGKADSYGQMLVEELKPFIDSQYRTLKDPANTGLGGVPRRYSLASSWA